MKQQTKDKVEQFVTEYLRCKNDFEYFDLTPDEPVNLTTELNTPEIEPFHLDIDEPANIVIDKTIEEVKEKTNEIEFLPSDSFKKEFQIYNYYLNRQS